MPRNSKSQHSELRRHPIPGTARLDRIYADLLTRRNVTGCFVGRKRVRGRQQKEISIVCTVSAKLPLRKLDRARDLVPPTVDWQTGGRREVIRTDVQELLHPFHPAALTGPGDDVVWVNGPPTAPHATVGYAMQHPVYGNVVTTAGHLFLPGGAMSVTFSRDRRPRVRLANVLGANPVFNGIALKAVVSSVADYALVAPAANAPADNRYRDVQPVAPPYLPSPSDVGKTLFVLTATGLKRTRFLGISATLPAGNVGLMHHLLVTTFSTSGGDSGACLVDSQGRVWGLLVGYSAIDQTPCSVFISSVVPLTLEQATFY